MATLHDDTTTPYAVHASADRRGATASRTQPVTGPTIFVWIAWALAAAFWALTMTTAAGILQATGNGAGPGPTGGAVDAGGAGWGLINVVGVTILGLAIAYGAYRYATRDRKKDPMTEASTAALYDEIESGADDGMSDRSPEANRPDERASYRPATRDPG
jgi:hypothetical protein